MKLRQMLATAVIALAFGIAPNSALAQCCDCERCWCDYVECYLPNYCDNGTCSANAVYLWCEGQFEGTYFAGCCTCT